MNDEMGTDYFSWNRVWEYFPQLLSRLPITLLIAFSSLVFGLIIGTLISIVKIYKIPILNQLATLYISFLRGTPVIIQVFIVFYGMPGLLNPLFLLFGIDLNDTDPIVFVIITYALSASAFLSVMISASILGVEKGQTEAGLSIGMTKPQLFREIIAPQAFHIALPELGNNTIALLKDTSLAFTVGVVDMVGVISSIAARTRHSLEGYIGAAIIYFVLCTILERCFTRIEKRNAVFK